MRLFNTISVEISSACNRSCKFCPVSVSKRKDEFMPDIVYQAIIGELSSLKYNGRVEFYIYNEPLKHLAHFERCVRQAHAAIPRATLMVSTNGDYMKSAEDLEWIYSLGIRQVVLNAYTASRYPVFIEWRKQVEAKLGKMNESVYSSIPAKQRAIKIYDKSNSQNFGDGVFALQNRAGSIPDFLPPTKEPVRRMCVKPFRLMNVNWRGEVLICCNDYYGDMPAGKIPHQTLVQAWNGPVMTAYRQHLIKKDRSLPLCRTCDCHAGAYPANVDSSHSRNAATREELEDIYVERIASRA